MAIEFFDKLTASVSRTAKQVSDNAKTLADKIRIRKDILNGSEDRRKIELGEVHIIEEHGSVLVYGLQSLHLENLRAWLALH